MSDPVAELGIASARIYKAFGSKEQLFREAIASYETEEGGRRSRLRAGKRHSPGDPTYAGRCRAALQPAGSAAGLHGGILRRQRQCGKRRAQNPLAEHRLQRTQQIVERLRQAVQAGELPADTDADSLGDFFAVFLHGLSIQARDGVTEKRLMAAVNVALTTSGNA